jgi:hypothetical protein
LRLREIAWLGGDLLDLEAPLIALPTGGEIAKQQGKQPSLPTGRGIPRIERDRLPIGRNRLVMASQLPERTAAIIEGIGVAGADRNGAVEARDRIVEPIEPMQGGTAIMVRAGVAGSSAIALSKQASASSKRSSASSSMPRLLTASAKSGLIAIARS